MKVKEYREKHNITQDEISRKLGMSQQTYSKKERGERGFSVKELLLLEKILGASISELFADL